MTTRKSSSTNSRSSSTNRTNNKQTGTSMSPTKKKEMTSGRGSMSQENRGVSDYRGHSQDRYNDSHNYSERRNQGERGRQGMTSMPRENDRSYSQNRYNDEHLYSGRGNQDSRQQHWESSSVNRGDRRYGQERYASQRPQRSFQDSYNYDEEYNRSLRRSPETRNEGFDSIPRRENRLTGRVSRDMPRRFNEDDFDGDNYLGRESRQGFSSLPQDEDDENSLMGGRNYQGENYHFDLDDDDYEDDEENGRYTKFQEMSY